MLNVLARARVSRVLDPIGAALARTGLSPDLVTVAGTAGVVVGSVVFVARGQLLLGGVLVGVAVLTDLLDGAMARARGATTRWGAFLDSTMDRIADGAIFGALAFWLAGGNRPGTAAAALCCLVAGVVVSYAKARAEGLGLRCDVGIAERTERLLLAGLAAVLELAGVPYGMDAVLWLLTGLAVSTVGQRVRLVWRATRGDPDRPTPGGGHPPGEPSTGGASGTAAGDTPGRGPAPGPSRNGTVSGPVDTR